MTEDVKYCYENDDTEDVARNMADIQVRRLPVLTRDKRLVGIISLGDMAVADKPGKAVAGISQPGGQHDQSENSGGTGCHRSRLAGFPRQRGD